MLLLFAPALETPHVGGIRGRLDGWTRGACVASLGQRYRELRRLKVSERLASAAIFSLKGPWRLSSSEALHRAFIKARFRRLGLLSMEKLASA